MSELICIVDEQDKPVGAATKQEAWDQGLIHRIVRIVVENSKGELLLQFRSPQVKLFPGCWDPAAAGHVDAGEDYEQAAYRELKEELGVQGENLTEIGKYRSHGTWQGKTLNRFWKLYALKYDIRLSDLVLQPEEVSAAKWWAKDELKAYMAEHPERITDGLEQAMEHYL